MFHGVIQKITLAQFFFLRHGVYLFNVYMHFMFVRYEAYFGNCLRCLPHYHLCVVEVVLASRTNQPSIRYSESSHCCASTSKSFR